MTASVNDIVRTLTETLPFVLFLKYLLYVPVCFLGKFDFYNFCGLDNI